MKIAILGTRGIPNAFGGFEQCAEQVGIRAVARGHAVTVYNPSDHRFRGDTWKGIVVRRVYSNERRLGVLNGFLLDYLALRDALAQGFDVVLELGYAPSVFYYPRRRAAKIVTNMAGMEWKRSKWGPVARAVIRHAERLAFERSDAIVSDNIGLQRYFLETYGKDTVYIPYGAELVHAPGFEHLRSLNLVPYRYYMLVARFQPDNNFEMILDGYSRAHAEHPFLVIGDHRNRYGAFLRERYGANPAIRFLGGIYEYPLLSALRWNARMYFHGHSCGGTNPSLLEAMASNAYIAAHDNPFNRNVLGDEGFYFHDAQDVAALITKDAGERRAEFIEKNRAKIAGTYTWERVTEAYLGLFNGLLNR